MEIADVLLHPAAFQLTHGVTGGARLDALMPMPMPMPMPAVPPLAQENVAIAPPNVLDELAFEGIVIPVLPDEEDQDDEPVGCELANKTWIKYGEQS